jgi:hypothetical protein
VPAPTYEQARATRTAASPIDARKFGSSIGDGASSMTFWWRRWMEHSRSPRCRWLPCASEKICISMWRGLSTAFSR